MERIQFSSSPIATQAALAKTLGVGELFLSNLANNTENQYTSFLVDKKNSLERRKITTPKPELMQIQRRINSRIFSACIFPGYLHGSIKDKETPRDFLSNAKAHQSSKTIITLDIKNFYPSISEKEVFKVFKYLFKYTDTVANLLSKLVTLDGYVPQGAPTSSFIANMIFYDHEPRMVAELERHGMRYTRLLDDITISLSNQQGSSKLTQKAISRVRVMCKEKGFKLHDGKQKIFHQNIRSHPATITGITLTNGRIGLPADYRNKVRSKVHHCIQQYSAGEETTADYHKLHNSTLGDVTLLKRLKYPTADDLAEKLNNCLPIYSTKKATQLRRSCENLAGKINPKTVTPLSRRYHVLIHCLTILSRTKPKLAQQLRTNLKTAFLKAKRHA